MKVGIFRIILQGLWKVLQLCKDKRYGKWMDGYKKYINYKLDGRRHVVACVEQAYDQVGSLNSRIIMYKIYNLYKFR